MDSRRLIEHFDLAPHPEGGWYRETYRSAGLIPGPELPEAFGGSRAFSTGILFLLRQGEYSHLHRIRQDEMWHFYLGGPLRLALIEPTGAVRTVLLGPEVLAGQVVQFVVPAGCWFGATPEAGTEFSFVGCTVAPGFDFADFELGRRQALERRFPEAAACVREFALE